MSHLGDRLTAMVDGELGHEARDRVLAHLTVCAECRAEAEAYRSLKFQLGDLGGPPPSPDLLERLLGLAAPGGPMPRQPPPQPGRGSAGPPRNRAGADPFGGAYATGPPGSPGPFAVLIASTPFGSTETATAGRPADNPSPARAGRARSRSSRLRLALVGLVSMVALALSAGFAAGGQPAAGEQVRRVAPPVDTYAVEHAVTVGEVPVRHDGAGDPESDVIFTDLDP